MNALSTHTWRAFMRGVVVFVVVLGVLMRLGLAGVMPMPGRFDFLRHAHAHAGYFGLVFPLCWLAWQRLDVTALPRRAAILYLSATTFVCVGFAFMGYRFPTIAASTVLGVLWVMSAWRGRTLWGRAPWLGAGPVAIVLATLCIPPIGVLTPRDPALGSAVAHSFLAILLFGLAVPTALSRLRAPAMPVWLWGPAALLGAGFVGVLPHPVTGLGLAVHGAVVAVATARASGDVIARVGFVIFAVSLVVVGVGVVPWLQPVSIAGVHVGLLGVVLLTLAPPPSTLERALMLGLALAMGAAVVAGLWWPLLSQQAAGVLGALLVVPLWRGLGAVGDDDSDSNEA